MAASDLIVTSISDMPSASNEVDGATADKITIVDEKDLIVENAEQHQGGNSNGNNGNGGSIQSILLDIAFLHNISTHRPLGPHKHFNIIPILINLERTARQVGARMRDDYYMRAVSADVEGNTTPSIKQEDEDDNVTSSSIPPIDTATVTPLDAKIVRERLNELYDVDGLEELENIAVDNDTNSPFRQAYACITDRSWQGGQTKKPFGFGSGLDKATKKTAKSMRVANRRDGGNEEEEEIREGWNEIDEFELGPWEEYEALIAPRRLKSFAPDEDNPSESDEELSEPSEQGESGHDGEQNEEEGEEEEEGGEEDGQDGDEDEEAEEEGNQREESNLEEIEEEEEEEVGDDQEAVAVPKRKSIKKSTISNKKSKGDAASKATRNSAKPRRSSRR